LALAGCSGAYGRTSAEAKAATDVNSHFLAASKTLNTIQDVNVRINHTDPFWAAQIMPGLATTLESMAASATVELDAAEKALAAMPDGRVKTEYRGTIGHARESVENSRVAAPRVRALPALWAKAVGVEESIGRARERSRASAVAGDTKSVKESLDYAKQAVAEAKKAGSVFDELRTTAAGLPEFEDRGLLEQAQDAVLSEQELASVTLDAARALQPGSRVKYGSVAGQRDELLADAEEYAQIGDMFGPELFTTWASGPLTRATDSLSSAQEAYKRAIGQPEPPTPSVPKRPILGGISAPERAIILAIVPVLLVLPALVVAIVILVAALGRRTAPTDGVEHRPSTGVGRGWLVASSTLLIVTVLGSCAASVLIMRPVVRKASSTVSEWQARLATDYPGWRVVGFNARLLTGDDGRQTEYVFQVVPPGRKFAVAVVYRSNGKGGVESRDQVLRWAKVSPGPANALLDFLETNYVRNGAGALTLTSESKEEATVAWTRGVRYGPLWTSSGSYDELVYDEASGTWNVWEESPLNAEPPAGQPQSYKAFGVAEYGRLNADPEKVRGARVDVVGEVFGVIESGKDGTFFQMFVDPDNAAYSTVVVYPGAFDVSEGDLVRVIGRVKGVNRFKNDEGEKRSAVELYAESLAQADETELGGPPPTAPSPATSDSTDGPPDKTVKVGKSVVRRGFKVTLDRVEFRSNEARVFLSVVNDSGSEVWFSAVDGYATQVGNEFKFAPIFSEYPEVQDVLAPGDASSGVVVWKGLKESTPFGLHFSAYVDESEIGTFDFSVKP